MTGFCKGCGEMLLTAATDECEQCARWREEDHVCSSCHKPYNCEPGDEPTRWCHPCAQEIAAGRDDAVAAARHEERERVLRILEAELQRLRELGAPSLTDFAQSSLMSCITRLREQP